MTTALVAGLLVGVGAAPPAQAALFPTRDYAVIGTIILDDLGALGTPNPTGIVIANSLDTDGSDDTVYVAAYDDDAVYVIPPLMTSGSVDDTIGVGNGPIGLAYDYDDDTLYVTNYADNTVSILSAGSTIDDTILVGSGPQGIDVDQDDDTVYVALSNDDSLAYFAPGDTSPQTLGFSCSGSAAIKCDTIGVAVDQQGGNVLVTNRSDDSVVVVSVPAMTISGSYDDTEPWGITGRATNFPGGQVWWSSSPSIVSTPSGDDTIIMLTDPPDGDVLFYSSKTSPSPPFSALRFLRNFDDTTADDSTLYLDYSRSGLGYVTLGDNALEPANGVGDRVGVFAEIGATLSATSGSVGDPIGVTIDVGIPGVTVDDSTLLAVAFGFPFGDTVEDWTRTGNTFTGTVPPGTGTVEVIALLNGLNVITLGNFTYTDAPAPSQPPGAPTQVNASAGDAAATVTWSAPGDAGSFPITNYEVVSTPAGGTCLVDTPATSCTVTGLTNGTEYTFRARALNGAGWGAYSEPSNAVIPEADPDPFVTITGKRGTGRGIERVIVTGVTDLPAGSTVSTFYRARGQAEYTEGRSRIVRDDGTFRWKVRSPKRTAVYVIVEGVRSNRVAVPRVPRNTAASNVAPWLASWDPAGPSLGAPLSLGSPSP